MRCSFQTSGPSGVVGFSPSPLLPIGGMQVKLRSRGSLLIIVETEPGFKRGERDLLSRLVSFLKEKLDAGAAFCLAPYHTALSNLGKLDLEAARGAQVRSRVRWTEEGEVSSAYFFRLIKKQSADRLVAALRCPDGTVVNSPPELVECFSQFYSDLFSAEPVDFAAQDVLLSNVSAHLSPSERDDCEGLLSVEECFTALQGMARRKAPGSDGLPMEFYLKFWSLLGSDLVRVLNSCFSAGRLSRSQRRGVISLSLKRVIAWIQRIGALFLSLMWTTRLPLALLLVGS